jgi:hypothetical protein
MLWKEKIVTYFVVGIMLKYLSRRIVKDLDYIGEFLGPD